MTFDNSIATEALTKVSGDEALELAYLVKRLEGTLYGNGWYSQPRFAGKTRGEVLAMVLSNPADVKLAESQYLEYKKKEVAKNADKVAARAYAKRIALGMPTDISAFPQSFKELVNEMVATYKAAAKAQEVSA